jgi:toxin ParE1/3/4
MSQRRNRPVRFRPSAAADLENIWAFTADRWSPDQADKYIAELVKTIDLLADNPNLARERFEFSPPVRIYVFRSHIIVFRDGGDYLDVIRLRHSREDWMSDPGSET